MAVGWSESSTTPPRTRPVSGAHGAATGDPIPAAFPTCPPIADQARQRGPTGMRHGVHHSGPEIGRRTRRAASAAEACVDPADRLDDGPGTPIRAKGKPGDSPSAVPLPGRCTVDKMRPLIAELRTFHRVAGRAGRPARPRSRTGQRHLSDKSLASLARLPRLLRHHGVRAGRCQPHMRSEDGV